MKTAAGSPICSSTGSLIGRSVGFVLLSAFDVDDADNVPAGVHIGRYISACIDCQNKGAQPHIFYC